MKAKYKKIQYFNPPDLTFQNLPVIEKVKIFEVSRMRNGYIVDVLISVDIQETVKYGEKLIQIYNGAVYRTNFKFSPFGKVIKKLFALGQRYNDEGIDLVHSLVKLIMNSLCGIRIRKDIDEFFKCKSEHWMQTEYVDILLENWKFSNGNYILKFRKHDGLDGDSGVKNTLISYLGAFILSNSKRYMNNFTGETNGFYNNSIYYKDTDSLYIRRNY